MAPELFIRRFELASTLETRMTVTNRTDENSNRIFLPYLQRKVMVNETWPRFATAGTAQAESIRAKDPGITADPTWRLAAHWLSVLNIVPESTDRSASCPDPEKAWVSPESHGLIGRVKIWLLSRR